MPKSRQPDEATESDVSEEPSALDEEDPAKTAQTEPRPGRRASSGRPTVEDEPASRTGELRSPAKQVARQTDDPIDPEALSPVSSSGTVPQPRLPIHSEDPPAGGSGPAYDAVLGETTTSPQYGLLGRCPAARLRLDLNQTHTISLFGVQGGGKSYTLGSVIEMACMPIKGVNRLRIRWPGSSFTTAPRSTTIPSSLRWRRPIPSRRK